MPILKYSEVYRIVFNYSNGFEYESKVVMIFCFSEDAKSLPVENHSFNQPKSQNRSLDFESGAMKYLEEISIGKWTPTITDNQTREEIKEFYRYVRGNYQ